MTSMTVLAYKQFGCGKFMESLASEISLVKFSGPKDKSH